MGGKKVFELMLEIGHKSQPLKSKLPNGYTHKWTVFVKGANNANIEHCIQRVVFQLHDSFPVPYREITVPPYQVKETGYAGFEIPVEVYFKSRDKTNHTVFMLDLCLLTNKPYSSSRIEKVKFFNPHKEFEKYLIKSGAQLLSVTKEKKERSDSPPVKKQKSSSSLIPSKDMCKQATPASHNQSSEFIDVFGAPLNYKNNNNHHKSHHNHSNHHHHHHHHHHNHHTKPKNEPQPLPQSAPQKSSQQAPQKPIQQTPQKPTQQAPQKIPQKQSQQPLFAQPDPLMIIQNKIASLSDCDRLQKIVDIVDESGEWFNLTPNKFEFDLKRLDKKTLSKIEKCLQL